MVYSKVLQCLLFLKKYLLKVLHKQLKIILKWEKKAESLSSLWNPCQNKTWSNDQYLLISIWKTVDHILEVRILIFFSSVAITFGSNFKGIFKVNTISVIETMPLLMVHDYHVTNYYLSSS